MGDLVTADRAAAGVLVLTLNRPAKKNALSAALLGELAVALRGAYLDAGVRAVVLTGADPAFCAGVDLTEIAAGTSFPLDAIELLRSSPVPLIAAVNGPAVTGGLEIALMCDFRIGSEQARFADTHARLGMTPVWGLTARLPQAVGSAWARQISLTGAFVDAPTALRIGLLNELVDHPRLLGRAVELGGLIARTDRAAAQRVRELYDIARDETGQRALAAEREPHVHVR